VALPPGLAPERVLATCGRERRCGRVTEKLVGFMRGRSHCRVSSRDIASNVSGFKSDRGLGIRSFRVKRMRFCALCQLMPDASRVLLQLTDDGVHTEAYTRKRIRIPRSNSRLMVSPASATLGSNY